jgi:hypothetical protein
MSGQGRTYMSTIKEELDELLLDPKERWLQYLENVSKKFEEVDTEKDFITVTISSPIYPRIMTDLIDETKNLYGLPSRMAEYAISGFGYNNTYKYIEKYNIIWQLELVKKIKRTFSSQKVINVKPPYLNIQNIKEFPSNKFKIYTHLEKRQYGMTGDLSLIYHIFSFNHAFYKNGFSELYQLYTSEEGLIKNVKGIIRSFDIEADNYIRRIYYYCKEELDIENYRNNKGYRNNEENIAAQENVIKGIECYISDIPIPVPHFN